MKPRGSSRREDPGRRGHQPGTDLADSRDLAYHTGVDLRQDAGAGHQGGVYPGRGAAEIERRQ
jgi:hypothetical protein